MKQVSDSETPDEMREELNFKEIEGLAMSTVQQVMGNESKEDKWPQKHLNQKIIGLCNVFFNVMLPFGYFLRIADMQLLSLLTSSIY